MEKEKTSYKRQAETVKKDLVMVKEQNEGLKSENAKLRQNEDTGENDRRLKQDKDDLEVKVRDLEDKLAKKGNHRT